MNDYQEHLRRLAVHDASHLETLAAGRGPFLTETIDERTQALVRFAATIAVDAPLSSFQHVVTAALAAGATKAEIVSCLEAVTPVTGAPRVVGCVPKVALALGYDVEEALEAPDP